MGYYDEEFYYEPSDFDKRIDEFKQSLLQSVKDDYVSEMEQLRKENAELQDVKKRMKEIEDEHRNKLRDFENQKSTLVTKIRRERLDELLGDISSHGWMVSDRYKKADKCDKCDEHRHLHYITPSGKDAYEKCECDKNYYHYYPKEIECYKFSQSKRSHGDYPTPTIYFSKEKYSDYDEYQKTTNIYRGDPFDKVRKYGIVFLDKETCQNYCDWLNEKEETKAGISNNPVFPKS